MRRYIFKNEIWSVDGALGEGYDLSETNSLEDFLSGKIIELNEEQILFMEQNPSASTMEIYNCAMTALEPYVPTLEEIRQEKISLIVSYDSSQAVNSFELFGQTMWLDRNTRMALMQTAKILDSSGEESTTLWTDGANPMPIEVSLLELQNILSILEIYAKKCYDVTAQHKYNIQHMDNKEDILAYDHTANYPDRIIINTPNNE